MATPTRDFMESMCFASSISPNTDVIFHLNTPPEPSTPYASGLLPARTIKKLCVLLLFSVGHRPHPGSTYKSARSTFIYHHSQAWPSVLSSSVSTLFLRYSTAWSHLPSILYIHNDALLGYFPPRGSLDLLLDGGGGSTPVAFKLRTPRRSGQPCKLPGLP